MPAIRPTLLTGLCWASMMALAIGINLLPVYLTTLGSAFGGPEGLTKEQLGRLGGIAFAGLVAGIVITGPLADRWGAKPFAILGNVLLAASLAASAFAPTYGTLAAALGVVGFSAGVLDMVLSPIVAALHPERRAAAMNWLHSFYCVGAVVTVLVGTLGLWAGVGWRGVSLGLAVLPLALVVAFAPLRFPAMVAESGREPFAALLGRRTFLIALVALFLGGATELGMAQWLPAYAETSLGYAPWVGGTGLLAFSLMMALGRMVVGWRGAHWDPYRVMALGCASSTVLFLGASFLPWPHAALACCVLVGFTGSCLWPTMLAVTADKHPNGGASMFGALAALGNAGGIVMPWMVGWIADRSDLAWGLATSAIAPALMLPLVLLLRPRRV